MSSKRHDDKAEAIRAEMHSYTQEKFWRFADDVAGKSRTGLRLRVLWRCVFGHESQSALAAELGISRQAVSKHVLSTWALWEAHR